MAKEMIGELVSRVFNTRNAAHLAHWQAKSYGQHVALGSFYDAVIEAVDAIAESYMGQFGPFDAAIVEAEAVKDIRQHIADEADWIEANRDLIAQGSECIAALVDNLTAVYAKTVFLLGLQ